MREPQHVPAPVPCLQLIPGGLGKATDPRNREADETYIRKQLAIAAKACELVATEWPAEDLIGVERTAAGAVQYLELFLDRSRRWRPQAWEELREE